MDRRRAGLDVRLHDLERVERAPEARLGIGDDRRQPVPPVAALGVRDLVGAQERVVDALRERRPRARGVKALVGVRPADEVRVRGDLPAREVDRLEPRLDHLHRLPARQRAERRDPLALREQGAKPLCAEPRERVLDADRAAQALDVLLGVRAGRLVHRVPFLDPVSACSGS